MGFFLRREKLATEAPKVKCFKRRGKERHVNANTIEVVPQLAIEVDPEKGLATWLEPVADEDYNRLR